MVTAEALRASWSAALARHGEIRSIGTPVGDPPGYGGSVVRIPVTFVRGALTVVVTVTRPAGSAACSSPRRPRRSRSGRGSRRRTPIGQASTNRT
jgi:hypothetical protein